MYDREPGCERLPALTRSCIAGRCNLPARPSGRPAIDASQGPRGGVVTQRSAKPCTPVQFRAWPPPSSQWVSANLRGWLPRAGSVLGTLWEPILRLLLPRLLYLRLLLPRLLYMCDSCIRASPACSVLAPCSRSRRTVCLSEQDLRDVVVPHRAGSHWRARDMLERTGDGFSLQ
jgi:hypothetical protein